MSSTSEILFEYLREMFYNSSGAVLDIEKVDEDFVMLAKGLVYFAQCFSQYNELAKSLAKGDLSVPLPSPENELAAPLKSLHSSLKHLTWQSQQVAMGDYAQRVDFMGEFSNAFNGMVEQLSDRQQKLENEIELSRKKTMALEQSNELLTSITQYIPQQIIVMDKNTGKILLMNEMFRSETERDPGYTENFMNMIFDHDSSENKHDVEIQYAAGGKERFFSVNSYLLQWNDSDAEAFVINDISAEKNKMKELETYAYLDSMTHLYNRFYGMLALNKLLNEKTQFTLIFADLDNLKYINDKYGHKEGDAYIIDAADHLRTFSSDAVVCRIGGDEFMVLASDTDYNQAHVRMNDIYQNFQKGGHLENKEYSYSISFGIIEVEKNTGLTASEILSIADERMYEHKQIRKKSRKIQTSI